MRRVNWATGADISTKKGKEIFILQIFSGVYNTYSELYNKRDALFWRPGSTVNVMISRFPV